MFTQVISLSNLRLALPTNETLDLTLTWKSWHETYKLSYWKGLQPENQRHSQLNIQCHLSQQNPQRGLGLGLMHFL